MGPRKVVKQNIQFDHYLDYLLNKATFRENQNISKSYLHGIRMIQINKLTLTVYDNKRIFYGNPHPIFSLSYGHYK